MSGYIFIGNSSKPTIDKLNSRDNVRLDNVAIPCVEAAINHGYHVVVGINRNNPKELRCEDYRIDFYDSHTYRSVSAMGDNLIAYKNLRNAVKEYDVSVIHCNTPVGGMVGRLVGRRCKIKTIIYTVHGFHFYKGAPLVNRIIFKFAERIMARWTDVIITMNEEDYLAAQKFRLRKGGRVYKVHGVGITLSDYENIQVDREKKRAELGLNDNDTVCISAGDIVARKNYGVAIEAIAKTHNPNVHYLICGAGPEREKLEAKVRELGIIDQVHFLGFRTDVKELLKISDVFIFTSLQEGLPRSLMEAMISGLPVVASSIRGNVDLIDEGEGGFLISPNDSGAFADKINLLTADTARRVKMGRINLERIKAYDINVVRQEIESIYSEVLG